MNGPSRPVPYRLKSTSLRLQIPRFNMIRRFLPEVEFIRKIKESDMYKTIARTLFGIKAWSRRTIWGDRVCFPPLHSLPLPFYLSRPRRC